MITSIHNERIKNVQKLIKKASERRKKGVFVTEGPKMFMEAPKDLIIETYISASLERTLSQKPELYEKLGKCGYEAVADDIFERISDTCSPQGILCIQKMPEYSIEDIIDSAPQLILAAENVQDPGNVGTMLRTAEAAGAGGVIFSSDCADVFSPKVIRSTMGSIYRVPFYITDDLLETMKLLKKNGIKLYAAHLKGNPEIYDDCDFSSPSAVFIGNESKGLRQETADTADIYLRIPMLGRAESLNAAMAAGIIMFEAARQRRKNG